MKPIHEQMTHNIVLRANVELDTFHMRFFRRGVSDAERAELARLCALQLAAAASSMTGIQEMLTSQPDAERSG